jgi:hypothetical protein
LRYEAFRKATKELGFSERAPLGVFELIIKTRWPKESADDYIGYVPQGSEAEDLQIIESSPME